VFYWLLLIIPLLALYVVLGAQYALSDLDRMVTKAHDKYTIKPGRRGILTTREEQDVFIKREFVKTMAAWPLYWLDNRTQYGVIPRANSHPLRLEEYEDYAQAQELLAEKRARRRAEALESAFTLELEARKPPKGKGAASSQQKFVDAAVDMEHEKQLRIKARAKEMAEQRIKELETKTPARPRTPFGEIVNVNLPLSGLSLDDKVDAVKNYIIDRKEFPEGKYEVNLDDGSCVYVTKFMTVR
jgi:hypothetical protein